MSALFTEGFDAGYAGAVFLAQKLDLDGFTPKLGHRCIARKVI